MYIVNFGCVLVFMTSILKNFDFFENFFENSFENFFENFLKIFFENFFENSKCL